jgi:hemerythrin-like domain-containing protein
MRPIDALRDEHAQLREQLTQLERAVRVLQAARVVACQLSESLSARLRSHVDNENHALTSFAARHNGWFARTVERLDQEHGRDVGQVAAVQQLLEREELALEQRVVGEAVHLMADVRAHMAAEEREVFPAMEDAQPTPDQLDSRWVQFLSLA